MTITTTEEEDAICMTATGFSCGAYFQRIMDNLTQDAIAIRKRSAADKLEKLPPGVRDTILATIDSELIKVVPIESEVK